MEEMHESSHSKMLPECAIMFSRVDEKLDALMLVIKEKQSMDDVHGRWVVGIAVTIILAIMIQVGTFLYLWGQLSKQVEVDSGRIASLEYIHPRLNQ